ncbi:MAG: Yip1 family protein, partial [Parvularculaceae bacterium]
MAQDIVGRVQRLLLSPKKEWEAIDQESVEPQGLITGYVAPLAAIPAIAGLIGMSMFGVMGFKTPFGSALVSAIVSFALTIGWVFVFAYIIDMLAPSFGAQKNYKQALKVSAFAPTASWVAGVFMLIPMLGIIALVGALYSLYLLFVGLPKMMKIFHNFLSFT